MPYQAVTPEENNAAWHATLRGDYAEAIQRYESILQRTDTLGELNNCGITHLLVGNLDKAMWCFQKARAKHKPPVLVHELIGTTLWLQGKKAEACQDWAEGIHMLLRGEITACGIAGDAPPSLWWASAHPEFRTWRGLAVKGLRKRWRVKRVRTLEWEGPIVPYLLDIGEQTDEILLAAALRNDPGPIRKARYLCDAYFYIAARALDVGDLERYYRYLQLAVAKTSDTVEANYQILQSEYHLALAELRNRDQS